METEFTKMRRILIVSGMMKSSQKAFAAGMSLAGHYNAELYFLHVIHNPFGIEGWNLSLPSLEGDFQRLLEDSQTEMEKFVDKGKAQGLNVVPLLREGEPVGQILAVVKEFQIDLILMLAHEEGRFEHFFFDRNHSEIIRRLPCSILLVKSEPGPVNW